MGQFHPRLAILLVTVAVCGCERGRTQVEVPRSDAVTSPGPPALKGMDEEQRQFLWQIEHHGNLLSRIGFPALATALREGDPEALARALATSFAGATLRKPVEVAIHQDVVDVVRLSDSGQPATLLNPQQFIAQLLEYRHFFQHKVNGCKIALMKLRPTREDQLDAPWEGTGQLRLWGERGPGQPGEAIVYLRYTTVRPTKAALESGKWLLSCAITQAQVGSAKHFLLRDVAEARGLQPARWQDNWQSERLDPSTGGVFLCDFDRDGILDVLITDINGYCLYKGLPGGRFQDVTSKVGLPEVLPERSSRALVAGWVDLDGDGWVDLILGGDVFRNVQGQRFENVSAQCNLRLPPNAGGVAIADYDGDGRMDVYVFHIGTRGGSWLDGKSASGTGNQLWRNLGDWRFQDVTAATGTDGGGRSTFTALWFDANNDGKPDLYVPNEFGDGVLYVNQGAGTFRPTPLAQGRHDFGTMGATCGDINNDGNIDLYCGNMYSKAGSRVIANVRPGTYPDDVMAQVRTFVKGSELHLNRGDLRFEQKGQAMQVADAGWAYGPALVDLDNDGWLDIYATCGYISRSRKEPDG
jgi:hypothetical protein